MFRWELDEPADAEFAGLSHDARKALAGFMDAVVIVDPTEYRRRPHEADGALRILPFGSHARAW